MHRSGQVQCPDCVKEHESRHGHQAGCTISQPTMAAGNSRARRELWQASAKSVSGSLSCDSLVSLATILTVLRDNARRTLSKLTIDSGNNLPCHGSSQYYNHERSHFFFLRIPSSMPRVSSCDRVSKTKPQLSYSMLLVSSVPGIFLGQVERCR